MNRPPRFVLLPLLQTQRDLLDLPPGPDRFNAYLAKMLGADGDVSLPLQGFNPMSKDHIRENLDTLLEIDAEETLDGLLEEIRDDQGQGHSLLKTGLVIADDIKGGWTNRATIQIDRWTQFEKVIWRGFAPLLWWASEPVTKRDLEFQLRRQIHEIVRLIDGRRPRSLEDILNLRFESALAAGLNFGDKPEFRELIERLRPYLNATDTPTLVACLFGDEAAVALGYAPLGIKASEAPGLR